MRGSRASTKPDLVCPGGPSCASTGDGVLKVGVGEAHVDAAELRDLHRREQRSPVASRREPYTDLNGNGKFDGVWLFGGGRAADRRRRPTSRRARSRSSRATTTFVIVYIDCIGMLAGDMDSDPQRPARSPALDIDHIIIGSTHAHDAPDIVGLWGPNVGGHRPRAVRRSTRCTTPTSTAITEAVQTAEPAQMTIASTQLINDPTNPMSKTDDWNKDIRDPVIFDPTLTVAQFVEGQRSDDDDRHARQLGRPSRGRALRRHRRRDDHRALSALAARGHRERRARPPRSMYATTDLARPRRRHRVRAGRARRPDRLDPRHASARARRHAGHRRDATRRTGDRHERRGEGADRARRRPARSSATCRCRSRARSTTRGSTTRCSTSRSSSTSLGPHDARRLQPGPCRSTRTTCRGCRCARRICRSVRSASSPRPASSTPSCGSAATTARGAGAGRCSITPARAATPTPTATTQVLVQHRRRRACRRRTCRTSLRRRSRRTCATSCSRTPA